MSDPIFSPDGQFMWTGSEWIPVPPTSTQLETADTNTGVSKSKAGPPPKSKPKSGPPPKTKPKSGPPPRSKSSDLNNVDTKKETPTSSELFEENIESSFRWSNRSIVQSAMVVFILIILIAVNIPYNFDAEWVGHEGTIYLEQLEVDNSEDGDWIRIQVWVEQGYAREFAPENICATTIIIGNEYSNVYNLGATCRLGPIDAYDNDYRISVKMCVSELNGNYVYDIAYDLDEGCVYGEGWNVGQRFESPQEDDCDDVGDILINEAPKPIETTGLRDGGGEEYNAKLTWRYVQEAHWKCT